MIRKECLTPYVNWTQPTGQEVREIMNMAELSSAAAATLLGVQSGRTVRRWTSDINSAPIPYAAWAILCEVAGLGTIWR